MDDSFESVMLLIMIIASIWAYYSIYKLDINPNPISFLDDLLLIICIPSFFLYGTLNIISGFDGSFLESTVSTNVLMVSRVNVQILEFLWSISVCKAGSKQVLVKVVSFQLGGHSQNDATTIFSWFQKLYIRAFKWCTTSFMISSGWF